MRAVLRSAVRDKQIRRLDLDEGVSQLVGPLLFQRVILGEQVTPAFARRLVAAFLAAHGHGN